MAGIGIDGQGQADGLFTRQSGERRRGGHHEAQYRVLELGRSGGTWMNTFKL